MFVIKKLIKIILTVISIVTIFIMVACQTNEPNQTSGQNGETAFELLERATIVMSEAEGMLISFSSETQTPAGISEMSIDIQNSGSLEVLNSGSTFEARAEVIQDFMGSETEYVAYFREESLYVDLETELGLKMKLDFEPANAFSLINVHLDFSEDAIIRQSIEETTEGTQLSFTLNDESLLEVIHGQLNGTALALEQLETADYELVVLLDDQQMIQSVQLQIELTYEEDDEMLEISMSASVDVSLSDDITFEFIGDPDEFMEFGEGNLPIF